jgi:hypothetical protein
MGNEIWNEHRTVVITTNVANIRLALDQSAGQKKPPLGTAGPDDPSVTSE